MLSLRARNNEIPGQTPALKADLKRQTEKQASVFLRRVSNEELKPSQHACQQQHRDLLDSWRI